MKKTAYIVTLALLTTLSAPLFAQDEAANQPPKPPRIEQNEGDQMTPGKMSPQREKRMNQKKRPPRGEGQMAPEGMWHKKGEMHDGKMMPPPDGMERPLRAPKGDKMGHPRPPRMNKQMRELVQKAKAGDAVAKEELKKCVDENFTKRIKSAEKQLKKQEAELSKVKKHVEEITANREAKVNEITEKMLSE